MLTLVLTFHPFLESSLCHSYKAKHYILIRYANLYIYLIKKFIHASQVTQHLLRVYSTQDLSCQNVSHEFGSVT